MKIVACEILSLLLIVTICSANEEGYLNAPCDKAQDCYVLDNVNQGLWLACSYSVNKCTCSNTIRSDFHLKWDSNQCLMSKYGPCGAKGELAVGCQDGFACIDNQCRDPANTKAVKQTPFVFQDSNCSNCDFSDKLRLECSYTSNQCECRKVYIADGRDSGWDIRNYAGDNDCSVGKFGPCGINNGIKIDCHGDGISCVKGTCSDPKHLISDVGEDCEYQENCKNGLLCSNGVCIEPFSLPESKICRGDNECQKGLQCQSAGPWSNSFCTKIEPSN